MKIQIQYQLSEAARKILFVETGIAHQAAQSIEVDPQTLSREDRAFLVGLSSVLSDSVTLKFPYWQSGMEMMSPFLFGRVVNDVADILPEFRAAYESGKAAVAAGRAERAQQELDRLQNWSSDHTPNRPDSAYQSTPLWDALMSAYSDAVQRVEAQQAVAAEQRRLEAVAETQQAARRDAEKAAWIAEHGSEYLRNAHGAGYDCQRLYVKERGAMEFPGYVIDFEDRAGWRSRSCPSKKALTEALEVDGTVVWLTRPGYEVHEAEYWEPCEAVIIRSYLGKYDLIKQF